MSAPSGSRDSSMGMNVVTTVMAFSVGAFFVLFIFARLLCARMHLRAAAAEHAAAAAGAAHPRDAASLAIHIELAGQMERGIRGMEPSVVTTFPTAKFGDDMHPPPVQEESQCTVCLEEYEAKDVVRVLPYCGHAFHVACIDAWLKLHSTCPICRASMRATAKHRAPATVPPVYYAVATARPPIQLSTSSSERNALQAEPAAAAAAGTDHMDMDVMASRLEISSDEPATSGAACPSAAPARGAGEYPCSGTARQSPQGNASENC